MQRLAPAIAGFLLALVVNAGAAARAEPVVEAPTPSDPLCVARDDDAWVACRFSTLGQRWETWKSPPAPLPLKAYAAVGPGAAAVLDPQAKYSGWLFDAGNLIWKAVPESPLGGRGGNLDPIVVAFVDGRLVAWGTSHPGPDGAVLDPKTMTWAPMARAPIKGRHRTPHAALGHKLIVWGGLPNFLQDGAIYDVRRDEWAALPPAPVAFRYGTASAMWRGKFVVVGGTMRGDASRTGAIYDPEINAWEQIEPAPFDVGCMSACAVAGDQLFLWSGPEQMRDAAATYDLVKKQWRAIAPAPMVGRVLAFARPVGSEVIVWGGWVSNPQEAFLPDGAAYDLTTDTWRAIPHLPFDVPKALHPGW